MGYNEKPFNCYIKGMLLGMGTITTGMGIILIIGFGRFLDYWISIYWIVIGIFSIVAGLLISNKNKPQSMK